MALTYEPIATATASGSSTSITFNSISGFTDLILIFNGGINSGADNICLTFNGDTSSGLYSRTSLSGTGSAAESSRSANRNNIFIDQAGYAEANLNDLQIFQIMNYANTTTYKTVLGRSNNAGTGVAAGVGLWRNTNAITSITLTDTATINIRSGSTITLYGIKAA